MTDDQILDLINEYGWRSVIKDQLGSCFNIQLIIIFDKEETEAYNTLRTSLFYRDPHMLTRQIKDALKID